MDTEVDKENEREAEIKGKEDDDESVPAPQVTIGADGEIVLNEARSVNIP